MISILARYTPHLSTAFRPVTDLLETDKLLCLVQPQITVLNQVKRPLLTKPAKNGEARAVALDISKSFGMQI